MAYGKILQHALRGARNLGQAGKNYGKIARDRGSDLIKNNPEYAIGAGLAGVVGGSLAHSVGQSREIGKVHQYQALRQLIKKETNGLGGLVYNKKKDEYVVTYAGSPQEMTSNKHFHALKFIIDSTNDRLDIKMRQSISALSPKQSKAQTKYVKKMLSTPEGAEKLQDYLASNQDSLSNPYSENYGNPFTKDLPSGDSMGTGDFR
jgi:hypothetical protein|tara:strand:+ start:3790 stop:4404 length:615 start_codon:yes stop_codon:yes gene_type:complete